MKLKRIDVVKQVKPYFNDLKPVIIVLFIICAFSIPLSLLSPKLFQILIDDVFSAGEKDKLIVVITGFLSLYFIRLAFDSINLYCSNRIVNSFSLQTRLDIWDKYKNLSYEVFSQKDIGDLKMRLMDDVNNIALFIKEQLIEYIYQIMAAIATLTLIFYISPLMALSCLWVVPIIFLINNKISKGNKKVNEEIRSVTQGYYMSTHNALQMWREIKVQNAQKTFLTRFSRFREKLAALGYKSIKYWFYNEVFGDFKTNYLSRVFVYCIGIYFVVNKKISIGEVVMFGEYFGLLFSSLDSINMKNASFKENSPYYTRISETLQYPVEQKEKGAGLGKIDEMFINIESFSYPGTKKEVLKNIKLELKRGETILITGESGCGKSTLIKLICGLYPSFSGNINVNGIDFGALFKTSWYKKICVIMQDNYIFNTTIRENILLGQADISLDDLIDCCKKSGAYDYISKLPEGFETIIGEKGIKLSGGQKQKMHIARAFLGKRELIIFDEATSSLDQISEDEIYSSLSSLPNEAIVIIISHRPSIASRADKVFEMKNGSLHHRNTRREM